MTEQRTITAVGARCNTALRCSTKDGDQAARSTIGFIGSLSRLDAEVTAMASSCCRFTSGKGYATPLLPTLGVSADRVVGIGLTNTDVNVTTRSCYGITGRYSNSTRVAQLRVARREGNLTTIAAVDAVATGIRCRNVE